MKTRTLFEGAMFFCWTVLVFFMLSIGIRFLTRQILVEKLGWDNVFTELVFWGDGQMSIEKGNDEEESEGFVYIDWKERYPFQNTQMENDKTENNRTSFLSIYRGLIASVEDKITTYSEDMLFGHYIMTTAAKKYNLTIGNPKIQTGGGDIIILNNGYLTYEEELVEEESIDALADSVADFSAFLKKKGIGYIYANAGSKVCPYDKELPYGAIEHTNENGDRLVKALRKRDISVLDFREYMERDGLDWYASYYITDHHWKNSTGLWAAGVLADVLNTHYGFSFDKAYFEPDSYKTETYEDYFLGGQGRALTFAEAEIEPFEKILPRFETQFSIQIPTKNLDRAGDYGHTLFDEEAFEAIADYSENDFLKERDAYGCTVWRNDALGTIQNHRAEDNQGKRILMLQDSFGWYLSTYLATDVPHIDLINMTGFDGSIRSYIEKTKPDVVVMLLCERNIRPIDWTAHQDYFDLR